MQNKYPRAFLFSLLLLVSLGCNPATRLPSGQNTPSVQVTSTSTPTPIGLPNLVFQYRVTGQEGEAPVTYSGIICDLAKPFTLKATTNWWEMNFELTPTSSQAGTFTITGTHYEAGPYNGEGTYTVNEGISQLNLNFTSLIQTLTNVGPVDVNPGSYHPTLIPLDTQECDSQ